MTTSLPYQQNSIHRSWMWRVLRAVADDVHLTRVLVFKGGTCAMMRGLLDRFSVDLDFDYIGESGEKMQATRGRLERIFARLGLVQKDASQNIPQYFLRYPARAFDRNTLKFEATTLTSSSNRYEQVRFVEIDRVLSCHTIDTMFAHKLVALVDRYERHGSIAGRDVYDIHHFFLQGLPYNADVIVDRRQVSVVAYLEFLHGFISQHVTRTIIDQDLNTLLTPEVFSRVRNTLRDEVLTFLREEIHRLG